MDLDSIKTYFAEVIARKLVPAALASAVAAIGTFLLAHAKELETYGVTYYSNFTGTFSGTPPTGALLVIEFDTLTKAAAVGVIAGVGILMAFLTHHTVATVTGSPQSGNVRTEPPQPIEGGQRDSDPPKEIK